MLELSSLEILKNKKNLLAFSGGADSTSLFFLLIKHNIKFDIAIVNYNQRAQSIEEVAYAKELASKYNLECHTLLAPAIDKNFESKARESGRRVGSATCGLLRRYDHRILANYQRFRSRNSIIDTGILKP